MLRIAAALVFLFSIFQLKVESQDWQCIRDSTSAYFFNNNLWAVVIDSVNEEDGYKYYYGFHRSQVMSTYFHPTPPHSTVMCFDPYGPSSMGKVFSAGEAGNFFFNSRGDAIRFCTLRQPGDPWVCCRLTDTSRIMSMVSQVTVEPVMGVTDSVKSIAFQAVLNTGDSITHPVNGITFKVSKNYGMITLFDFAEFPAYNFSLRPVHYLSGLHSPHFSKGEKNITWKDVYSFAPGDIFHIERREDGPHNEPDVDSIVHIILDSTWNSTGDTVLYKYRRIIKSYDPDLYPIPPYSYYNYIKEDKYYDQPELGLSKQPDENNYKFKPDGTLNNSWSYAQIRTNEFYSRWMKVLNSQGNAEWWDPCADSLLSGSADEIISFNYESFNYESYFLQGCGGSYYQYCRIDSYYDGYCYSYLLKYYKKGDETWGIPFDTSGWQLPDSFGEIVNESEPVEIYPNPARDRIHLRQKNPGQSLQARLLNIWGREVAVFECNQTDNEIMLEPGWKGVYYIELTRNDRIRTIHKLIIL